MRCAIRLGLRAGTIRHVHGRPRSASQSTLSKFYHSFFADDSQLLGSTTPSGAADVYGILERCMSAVDDWCTRRRLLLKLRKTEAIWFGSSVDLDHLADTDVTICLDQATIHPSDCVRDLGVLLDSSLSMRQHIAKVASTCFFHLRRLRRLRRVLDLQSRKRLACAFVLTRIDYTVMPFSPTCRTVHSLHCSKCYTQQLGLWLTLGHAHAIMSRLHSFRCTGYQSVNESLTNCVP